MGPGYLSHYILIFPMLLGFKFIFFSARNKYMIKLFKSIWNLPSFCCNSLIRVAALDLVSGIETWYDYQCLVLSRTCKMPPQWLLMKYWNWRKGKENKQRASTLTFNYVKMCDFYRSCARKKHNEPCRNIQLMTANLHLQIESCLFWFFTKVVSIYISSSQCINHKSWFTKTHI
jgi:hypothetical protein